MPYASFLYENYDYFTEYSYAVYSVLLHKEYMLTSLCRPSDVMTPSFCVMMSLMMMRFVGWWGHCATYTTTITIRCRGDCAYNQPLLVSVGGILQFVITSSLVKDPGTTWNQFLEQ
jgi:hypothetical protein